jgi:dimethylhistidine N-methyltransferase
MSDNTVHQSSTPEEEEIDSIIAGLMQPEKMISPKYFYDEVGSKLFDDITELPEYYPTQTELGIMQKCVGEIADLAGERASLIEFGSGSSMKTHVLLRNLRSLAAYVPVDISEEHLLASADSLRSDYPHIEIIPVVADFTKPFDLPTPVVPPEKNIVYFPGSTIGNFPHEEARALLQVMYGEAGAHGALLIGVDLQKDAQVLERAYNDSAGVTAAFNRNMLTHLNREFGADFDVGAFRHDALYNADKGRIELRLIAESPQVVHLGGATIRIDAGEGILTEYSHKYTLDGFAELAASAGFAVERVWMDDDKLFSVQYLVRD